jgi:hypothetical protein
LNPVLLEDSVTGSPMFASSAKEAPDAALSPDVPDSHCVSVHRSTCAPSATLAHLRLVG